MGATCPNCGRPISAGAFYCIECGVGLPERCQTCNTPNPPGSRFCRECGANLAAGATGPGTANASPPAEVSSGHAECPRCRNLNEPGAAYCYACGLPFDEARAPVGALFPAGRPAGFWVRVAARLIDGVALLIVELVLIAIWPGVTISAYFQDDQAALWTSLDSVLVIGNALYYVLGLSIWATTVGKRLMGIYVLRPDGAKLGPGRAFARYLAEALSALLLLAGYLMVAIRRDKRALHDLICDTVVVHRR